MAAGGAVPAGKGTGWAASPTRFGTGRVVWGALAAGEVDALDSRNGRGGGIWVPGAVAVVVAVDAGPDAGADCDWAAHGVGSTPEGSKAPIRNNAQGVCSLIRTPLD
jgi:hypothetical protein